MANRSHSPDELAGLMDTNNFLNPFHLYPWDTDISGPYSTWASTPAVDLNGTLNSNLGFDVSEQWTHGFANPLTPGSVQIGDPFLAAVVQMGNPPDNTGNMSVPGRTAMLNGEPGSPPVQDPTRPVPAPMQYLGVSRRTGEIQGVKFKCDECQEVVATQRTLNRHKKKHGDTAFTCHCGRRTARKDNHCRHIRDSCRVQKRNESPKCHFQCDCGMKTTVARDHIEHVKSCNRGKSGRPARGRN